MRFDVITLFPEIFASVRDCGITARARKRGLWSLNTWNPRDTATDLHRTIDDRPFGGGPGMVMMAEPLAQTLAAIRQSGNTGRVMSFAPNGTRLTDRRVRKIAADDEPVVLVCGRYEGIDERFLEAEVDEVVSLGDFVLSGGEIPACALIDAVVRQLPGAISRLPMRASRQGFSTRRTIRGPKSGAACRCRRCSFRGTTRILKSGRAKKVSSSPCRRAPTSLQSPILRVC